jgi:hypothetical protein
MRHYHDLMQHVLDDGVHKSTAVTPTHELTGTRRLCRASGCATGWALLLHQPQLEPVSQCSRVALECGDGWGVFPSGRFQSGNGGLGGSHPLSDFCLSKSGFRARFENLVEEGELILEGVVCHLDAWLGQGLALELLQRARHL